MVIMVSEQLKIEIVNLMKKVLLGELIVSQACYYLKERHLAGTQWIVPYPDCLECKCGTSVMSCCGYVAFFLITVDCESLSHQ